MIKVKENTRIIQLVQFNFNIYLNETEFKRLFPDNFVQGELAWGAASLIIASVSAASAMMGFIEFQFDLEEETVSTSTN